MPCLPKCRTIETWGTAAIGACVRDNAVFPRTLLRERGLHLEEGRQSMFGSSTKASGIHDFGKGRDVRIYRSA